SDDADRGGLFLGRAPVASVATQPGSSPQAARRRARRPRRASRMSTLVVSERWLDEWLRENWDADPSMIEHTYGLGIISTRQYLDATRDQFQADLDRLIIDSVAETLTI